jgi:hypothetical protein
MANWKATVDLSALWMAYRACDIELPVLAHAVADKLRALPGDYQDDYQFEVIVDELADFHPDDTVESFNYILSRLYDWADEGHRLWVKTF